MTEIFARTAAPTLVALIWLTALFALWRAGGDIWAGALAGLVGGSALILQAAIGGPDAVWRVFGPEPAAAGASGLAVVVGAALTGVLFSDRSAAIDEVLAPLSLTFAGAILALEKAGAAVVVAAAIGHVAGRMVAAKTGTP